MFNYYDYYAVFSTSLKKIKSYKKYVQNKLESFEHKHWNILIFFNIQ